VKVSIVTPTHSGQVYADFAVSLANTVKALTAAGIEAQFKVHCFGSFIHAVRDKLAHEFLASDYTDLVFIDADMGWDVDGLINMLMRDVDVVGAICPKRRDPMDWAVNLLSDGNGNRIERDGLLEAAYVGTALLRIRRNVFEKMGRPYFNAGFEGDGFIGEDAWFCREWRALGGRIWAEPNITVTHAGPKQWRGNYQEMA
jgi:hypothetical protein